MDKLRRFFGNFNEKRTYQIVFFVVSMCVVFAGYFVIRDRIKFAKEWVITEDSRLVGYVEDISVQNKEVSISGWCFYEGWDSSNTLDVFLQNIEDRSEVVQLKVSRKTRNDIAAYYDSEIDYSQCGYVAKTKLKNLDLEQKTYEIIIKIAQFEDDTKSKGEQVKVVSTGKYIYNSTIVNALNKHNMPTQVESNVLNDIFTNGILLVSNEEKDIYIFQYKDKLYWVAGEDFVFNASGFTLMEVFVNTTKVDCLPVHIKEKGMTTDCISFYFELNELLGVNTYPYRVAVQELPQEYPITNMLVGEPEGGTWGWVESINVDVREFFD